MKTLKTITLTQNREKRLEFDCNDFEYCTLVHKKNSFGRDEIFIIHIDKRYSLFSWFKKGTFFGKILQFHWTKIAYFNISIDHFEDAY